MEGIRVIDPKATYRVSTWDAEDQTWIVYKSGCTAKDVIEAVYDLEDMGWDRDVSILVERESA
jgi:hypothetical protein